MAKVKGSVLRSNVAFLQEKLGPEGWARVVALLDERDREAVGVVVLQSAWYEYSLVLRVMAAAEGLYTPPGNRSMAWEMGRFSAEFGLKTVYKIFFKVADPHHIIGKASQIFSNYFDSGTMELVALDRKSAHLRITGFDQPCAPFCDRAMGWMERTLELAGAHSVSLTHPTCAARGGAHCDFLGRWA